MSFPATRSTKRSPSTSTFRLWFVMPPPSTSNARVATRPDALDLGREVAHARIRSPGGIEQRLGRDDARHPLAEDLDRDLGADVVLGGQVRVRDRLLDRVAVAAARHPPDEIVSDANRLRAEGDRPWVVERQAAEQPLRLVARRRAPRGR